MNQSQQGTSQFQSGFGGGQSQSGPFDQFKQKVQRWSEGARLLQSKANLSSAEVGKIQELLQLSTQYSKEAETYSVALKDAETSEAFLSSTIWAKPHETRGKMSVPEAEDLLSKISIKPSTSLFSSDVDWISEGSKENLRKLGLKADTLESTILQLENLKSNLGTWKRSSLKLTPSLGSQQSATALLRNTTGLS